MKFLQVFILIALVCTIGCQRNKFPVGGAKEAKNPPQYSVEPNVNGGTKPLTPGASLK